MFILKTLEIDLLLLECEEFTSFEFQNRRNVRSYGRVKVYIECGRTEGVSFIFDRKGFFMMEAVKSISSFESLFFKLQEYCNRFEEFNGFKQDFKLQGKSDGEKWERPWVYKEDKDI